MDFQNGPFSHPLLKKLFSLTKVFSFINAIAKFQKPSKATRNAKPSKQSGTESFFGIDKVTDYYTGGVLLPAGARIVLLPAASIILGLEPSKPSV